MRHNEGTDNIKVYVEELHIIRSLSLKSHLWIKQIHTDRFFPYMWHNELLFNCPVFHVFCCVSSHFPSLTLSVWGPGEDCGPHSVPVLLPVGPQLLHTLGSQFFYFVLRILLHVFSVWPVGLPESLVATFFSCEATVLWKLQNVTRRYLVGISGAIC